MGSNSEPDDDSSVLNSCFFRALLVFSDDITKITNEKQIDADNYVKKCLIGKEPVPTKIYERQFGLFTRKKRRKILKNLLEREQLFRSGRRLVHSICYLHDCEERHSSIEIATNFKKGVYEIISTSMVNAVHFR